MGLAAKVKNSTPGTAQPNSQNSTGGTIPGRPSDGARPYSTSLNANNPTNYNQSQTGFNYPKDDVSVFSSISQRLPYPSMPGSQITGTGNTTAYQPGMYQSLNGTNFNSASPTPPNFNTQQSSGYAYSAYSPPNQTAYSSVGYSPPPVSQAPQHQYAQTTIGSYPAANSVPYSSPYANAATTSPYAASPYAGTTIPPYSTTQYSVGSNTSTLISNASPNTAMIKEQLHKIIQINNLQRFYSGNELNALLTRACKIDFASIAKEWKISLEMAVELSALALYDIAVFADDSGSMSFEENGSRIDDLIMILGRISKIATLFDDDGILIRFFNNDVVGGDGIRSESEARELISRVRFSGLTPLGTKLEQKIIEPFVFESLRTNSFRKPLLIFVITDGEPSGESNAKVLQVIQKCRHNVQSQGYGRGVAFEFAQVGKDAAAQRFLSKLDNDQSIGDVVDVTSYFELEQEEFAKKGVDLTPDLWLLKLMLGAIDPSYDEQD